MPRGSHPNSARTESDCSRKVVPIAPAKARPTALIVEKFGCSRFSLRDGAFRQQNNEVEKAA